MKLDQNAREDKRPKYALVEMRKVDALKAAKRDSVKKLMLKLHNLGVLNDGSNPDEAAFVLKLKDKFAPFALHGYAKGISEWLKQADLSVPETKKLADELIEFAREINELAKTARALPKTKFPD